MYVYQYYVKWYFDGKEENDYGYIYAETYKGAMETLMQAYADEDIEELTLKYISDMLLRIPKDRIKEINEYNV